MIPQSPPPTLCRVLSRIIFAAAVLLSLSTAAFAGQSEASGSKAVGSNLRKHCGKLSETEVAQNLTSQSTNSTSFVNVIGSGVSFVQGGTSAGCVIVSFSAQAFTPSSIILIQALLDGVVSDDGQVNLAFASGNFTAYAYNFLFPAVSPGSHTLRMQYTTGSPTVAATIRAFELNIRHR